MEIPISRQNGLPNKTLSINFGRVCPYSRQAGTISDHITLTSQWPRWRLKSPASRLFTQSFIHTQIKENIKAPRHWPLWGEFTGTGEFPAQRPSYAKTVSIWWRHHDSPTYIPVTRPQWLKDIHWYFMSMDFEPLSIECLQWKTAVCLMGTENINPWPMLAIYQ